MNLVMCCKDLNYADAAREVERVVGIATPTPPVGRRDPRIKLNRVHKATRRPGAAVREYLAGRGLECPPCLKQVRERYYDGKGECLGEFEAMAARVLGADGTPETYHLTYLEGSRKADVQSPRKVLTPVNTINGAAVRLYPAAAHLGIAEGIETAIAAHMLYGIPVWSVLNRNGIDTFVPPEGTDELTIFADNDASFVGQASAFGAAKRLSSKPHGIRCHVLVPRLADTDWNDELLARGSAA
jgi:putative DNA primase/helicase